MLYRGFNERELKAITDILDRNSVVYTVSVPDASLDYINDPTKRVDHRFMDNLLQIEIANEEFSKLSEKDLSKLFDLRIYKEEESPFSDEELANLETENKTPAPKKPNEHAKSNQLAAILAVLLVTLFFLWKNKII